MRIRDWSSDVCSSDLDDQVLAQRRAQQFQRRTIAGALDPDRTAAAVAIAERCGKQTFLWITQRVREIICHAAAWCEAIGIITKALGVDTRSEEHTSELQSLMRILYAVFCLIKQPHTTIM